MYYSFLEGLTFISFQTSNKFTLIFGIDKCKRIAPFWPRPVSGTLLHPIPPVPGQTALAVRIEKMGLKEGGYIDPFITVSVKGKYHIGS